MIFIPIIIILLLTSFFYLVAFPRSLTNIKFSQISLTLLSNRADF